MEEWSYSAQNRSIDDILCSLEEHIQPGGVILRNLLIEAIKKANKGYWDDAHVIVQQIEDPVSYWLHANLHREEGDLDNAKYWYHRATREYVEIGIEDERQQILNLLMREE